VKVNPALFSGRATPTAGLYVAEAAFVVVDGPAFPIVRQKAREQAMKPV
jgi:hypothetical protein